VLSHRPAVCHTVAPLSHQSKLTLKVSDWKCWTCTDGSCHTQEGKTFIGEGIYHPSSGNSNLVEPNGAGLTNTIGRAELAAIAVAITYNHIHIAKSSNTCDSRIQSSSGLNFCCKPQSKIQTHFLPWRHFSDSREYMQYQFPKSTKPSQWSRPYFKEWKEGGSG